MTTLNKDDKALIEAIEASEEGFVYVAAENATVQKLVKEGYIIINEDKCDDTGKLVPAYIREDYEAEAEEVNKTAGIADDGVAIDTGIKIPKTVRAKRKTKYPFAQLEVGQSFHVPVSENDPDPVKLARKLASAASNARGRMLDENGNKIAKFVSRSVDEKDPRGPGARVFRVALD